MEQPDDGEDPATVDPGAEEEEEEEDLLAAILGIARAALARADENLMLLAGGVSGIEFDPRDIEFELEVPGGRADAVASAISALDARWRLILGAMSEAQPGIRERAVDVAALLVPAEYGLVIVHAEMGSLRFRLRLSGRSRKLLTTAALVLAGTGGLAETSGYSVRDAIDAVRGDGERCEQVAGTPLNRAQREELDDIIGRLPSGTTVRMTAHADDAAHVRLVLPPPRRGQEGTKKGRR